MELNEQRYFIVLRRNKKGLSRGTIGRADAETTEGELIGMVYGGGGSTRSSGTVKKHDTYPLSRHQAGLLMLVCPASRRLELLGNLQLFSAICELARDDLVMVKHKKSFQPCLVKNLVQIGKKDKPGDLKVLGFELELVETENEISLKKTSPLPFFSAADILQVAPSDLNTRIPLRDAIDLGLKRKAVSLLNSLPALNSRNAKKGSVLLKKDASESIQALSHYSLEVGSMAEVLSLNGLTVYGVIRWIGVPEGKKNCWAGLELDTEATTCSDGTLGTKRYFTCEVNKALFVPLTNCKPDSRFLLIPDEMLKPLNISSATLMEDLDEDVPPVAEQDVLSHLVGRMKGIQGHFNSCYLDATLFSLFTSSIAFDRIFNRSADSEKGVSHILRRDIVNCLRRSGFVPAENVMKFREQLGCKSFASEEKDPEEFITLLLQHVLHIEPLLKIRSQGEFPQEAFMHQIIVEKNQVAAVPSVQQLLEMSFVTSDLKFEEIPSCLIVQMPRFGKKFKMFPKIIPSTDLDITDILHCSPRECFLCGHLAEYECVQCLMDRKLQPGKIKQYCSTCNTQVHNHPSRQEHTPQKLTLPDCPPEDAPVQRHQMQLFAVLCINTSHYVSFVKYGPDPRSWIFFDSMADRCGDDNKGYSVPVIRSCPEVGDFLSQSEEEISSADLSQCSEAVRRLMADSYMCLYQTTDCQQ
ncbi:ubiquitin carboxyl-terminal hydrolase CYLD [Danio aesculapii]|uniref:ubiquitin carboxyl-terminal hydrolase CYLD n=1 Tax=Danio aesculapii TaxID=1142201 RepID=UPI0024BFAFEA|nr:ubiquitin carboxyl-terminal hydrolase CYLD [Danio aesculapii]